MNIIFLVKNTDWTKKSFSVQQDLLHFLLALVRRVVVLTERAQCAAGEEDDSFQFSVEEKVVKVPNGSVFPERIGDEVGIVGENVAVQEDNLLVQADPELLVDLAVLARGRDTQEVVDVVGHELEVRFLRELVGFRGGKVVVGKGRIESGDEGEESLPVDGVAQDVAGLVLGAGAAREGPGVAVSWRHGVGVASVSVLRRRQRLQRTW